MGVSGVQGTVCFAWQRSLLTAPWLPIYLWQDVQFSIVIAFKLLIRETMLTEFLVDLVSDISSFSEKRRTILKVGYTPLI